MPPKFGTSGLRGLVTDLTDDLVADYTRAFLAACPNGGALWVGRDLRPSSPRIADAVIAAARAEGIDAVDAGDVPTPALAMAAMEQRAAAVMVTGSHIPADRNGLKFYLPTGEIAKRDEAAILNALGRDPGTGAGGLRQTFEVSGRYELRYIRAFGRALAGLRIGVWQHSSVARDILVATLRALDAEVVPLDRSASFVPVDTEAVDAATRASIAAWCAEHRLDALVSTDGDGDRPMLAAADGRIVPGDILGPLTARFLGAGRLCTPVNSNTAVDAMSFAEITRTRIGSPFVIAAMEEAGPGRVAGYEANGGFLLGFEARGPAGLLPPLMTRDSLLPIIAPLAAARAARQSLPELVATLPARFTAADRLQDIDPDRARAFLEDITANGAHRAAFFDGMPAETGTDLTDGLRVTFEGGAVVHLRPSGNAPEFRCYAEAETPEAAQALLGRHLEALAAILR